MRHHGITDPALVITQPSAQGDGKRRARTHTSCGEQTSTVRPRVRARLRHGLREELRHIARQHAHAPHGGRHVQWVRQPHTCLSGRTTARRGCARSRFEVVQQSGCIAAMHDALQAGRVHIPHKQALSRALLRTFVLSDVCVGHPVAWSRWAFLRLPLGRTDTRTALGQSRTHAIDAQARKHTASSIPHAIHWHRGMARKARYHRARKDSIPLVATTSLCTASVVRDRNERHTTVLAYRANALRPVEERVAWGSKKRRTRPCVRGNAQQRLTIERSPHPHGPVVAARN
mmetsp:Transcript_11376/g.47556  ORF Transcript_11376/g.47556 Transcript_11376/m.47556 type:complete len:288 (+) Transcript_11376:1958-2821(+)